MDVTIPDRVVKAAGLTEDEVLREVAVMLYREHRVSTEVAFRLARMDRIAFQKLLASRGIEMNYTAEEFARDLETLKRLGRL